MARRSSAPAAVAPRREGPGDGGACHAGSGTALNAAVDSIDAAEIRDAVGALARPRRTGSPGAREVAGELRRRFGTMGYRLRELDFSFSTLPGRYGLPAAGAALMVTGGAGGSLLATGRPTPALAVLTAGVGLAVLPLLLLGPALRRVPWGRVETTNLLFTRDVPRWIVMAHRDTKSQPVPTLLRSAAVALTAVAWVVLTVLAVAGLAGATEWARPGLVWAGTATLVVSSSVLAVCRARNDSPGALDNGTGLATLLAVAARVASDVGFLITDGEELGLAGARAAATRLPDVAGIINVDGLDDDGPVRIAESRPRVGPASVLAGALVEHGRALGFEVVRRRVPPFILVDHEPLAAAGLPALSVLKGRWQSLLRVHRPDDSVGHLSGVGAAQVATLLVATLGTLAGKATDTLRHDEPADHSPAP